MQTTTIQPNAAHAVAAPISRWPRALAPLFEPCLYWPAHAWFLALAALDLILTTVILNLGGAEANLIPCAVLAHAGMAGMVALKAASVITVLVLCESIGRRRESAGRAVALIAIAANTAAATLGLACIAVYHTAAYL
jgi:Domain of unknown function (DUF5658)